MTSRFRIAKLTPSIVMLEWVVVIALALYCGYSILLSTAGGGPRYTPDSINFITAARTLVNGEGLWRYIRIPFTTWPPLYPIFLGSFDVLTRWTGQDMMERLRYLNALSYGGLALVTWALFRSYTQSRLVLFLGLILTLLSPPITRVFATVWTEGPFMLFVAGYLWALARLVDHPSPARLALVLLLIMGGTMLRLAGIALVPIAMLSILLFMHTPAWKHRLSYCLLCLLAAIPYVLWLLYGLSLPRQTIYGWSSLNEALSFVWTNIAVAPSLMAAWFNLPDTPLTALFVVVLAFSAITIIIGVYVRSQRMGSIPSTVTFPIIAAIYFVLYLANLYAGMFGVYTLGADSRHFSVLIIPFGLLLVALVDLRLRKPVPRPLNLLIVVLGFAWAGWLLWQNLEIAHNNAGSLSQANIQRTDPLVQLLRQSPVDGRVYSNTPFPLFYTAQVVQAAPLQVEEWLPILEKLEGQSVYLAWYENGNAYSPRQVVYFFDLDYTVENLSIIAEVELMATTETGRLFRLSARNQ